MTVHEKKGETSIFTLAGPSLSREGKGGNLTPSSLLSRPLGRKKRKSPRPCVEVRGCKYPGALGRRCRARKGKGGGCTKPPLARAEGEGEELDLCPVERAIVEKKGEKVYLTREKGKREHSFRRLSLVRVRGKGKKRRGRELGDESILLIWSR